jgi:hypothetical protein
MWPFGKTISDDEWVRRQAMEDPDYFDYSKPYDYRRLRPPPVSMYDPIPKELMRNLPPWVYRLQIIGYLLMMPFGIALMIIYFGGSMGWW